MLISVYVDALGVASEKGSEAKERRETAPFIGENVRPVRRYFSKEAKSRLVREARALEDNEGAKLVDNRKHFWANVAHISVAPRLRQREAVFVVREVSLACLSLHTKPCFSLSALFVSSPTYVSGYVFGVATSLRFQP